MVRGLNNKTGFTLIELIVTMAIIGFLAGVVLTGMNKTREKSRDVLRAGDLKSLSKAAESYFSEHFEFPNSLNDLGEYYTGGTVPQDPSPDRSYQYMKTSSPRGYCLGAMMETDEASNDTDCGLQSIPNVNYQLQGP